MRIPYRLWYYFRIGYGTYLTFLLGYTSTLVTVYYLAVKNIPLLLDLFPKFNLFAILATVIGAPASMAIGWLHLKRSFAFSSETEISAESNPYNYRLAPGITTEVNMPANLLQLQILRKLAESHSLLAEDEKKQLEELEGKYLVLLKGGYVGSPKRKMDN
jgi:hypothetical protein